MAEENKKSLNTNSNSYTLVYSIILVVIVAFLLAFVSKSLKPIQDVNVALDKKKQILYALNIRGLSDNEVDNVYKKVITADRIIDTKGNIIEKGEKGGERAAFLLNSADYKEGRLALYICNVDGKEKYVLPVFGMGLWGSINGYIAINSDKATIFGAYFDHESETAGLGAEIKDNIGWQQKFNGKKIFSQTSSDKIAIAVIKKVEDINTQVDGITGATLTSTGVSNMLQEGFAKYLPFLKSK